MSIIGTLLFFICLSFLVVIFGVIILALYLKSKMTVFKEVQMENESYHHEPYTDTDFHSIGQERTESVEIVDADYHTLPDEEETQP